LPLEAVVEEELGTHKLSFEGNFETLYHGARKDRERFRELTPEKQTKKLINKSIDLGQQFVDELYASAREIIDKDLNYIEAEKETRTQILITEQLEELFKDTEFKDELGKHCDDLERFILYKKMLDTFNLFIDYSIQDTQLLYDLEKKLKKFDTLMMLAQYNVSAFYDVFSTLKQTEQGISNFAHIHSKKVVMDREYDKTKQIYNKFIDKDLLRIRMENDYKILPDDPASIKLMKELVSQQKIPGANVLSPNIGLISFDDAVTPKLAREFKTLKAELMEIDKLLEEMEED